MTRAELAEAIPPVYTEFIGKQIIDYIRRGEADSGNSIEISGSETEDRGLDHSEYAGT